MNSIGKLEEIAKVALATIVAAGMNSACADSAYPFTVESIKEGAEYHIVARNYGHAPIDVTVSLTKVADAVSDSEWPIHRIIAPAGIVNLARIYGANPAVPYSFTYQTQWLFGDPESRPNPSATYRLPFENGRILTISQGPGGPLTTHNSPDSMFAVDIPMPEGTPIVAARAGYILRTARQYGVGRFDPAFLDKANFVEIMHDDGTFALYAHLVNYSSMVVSGTRVDAGTVLGLAGSSGYSSGPHLHFAVQRNENGRVVSIPFRFNNGEKGAFSPAVDMRVAADYARKPIGVVVTGMPAAGVRQLVPRSARVCMGAKNVVDEVIVSCMTGEGPLPR